MGCDITDTGTRLAEWGAIGMIVAEVRTCHRNAVASTNQVFRDRARPPSPSNHSLNRPGFHADSVVCDETSSGVAI